MVSGNGTSPSGGHRIGVLLAVFDFPMLVAGLRSAIEAELDLRVAGEVAERELLATELEAAGPDVIVVELAPFAGNGSTTFGLLEQIRLIRPAVRILALECRGSGDQFSMALKAGADGYLTREAAAADVVAAIRCVAHGQTYVSPAIVTKMVNTYVLRTDGATLEDAYDALSEREREVLLLAAVGHTNREIAKVFHLSEQTVHNYRATIMEKLGMHDRVDLLKYAIRRGVIDIADL